MASTHACSHRIDQCGRDVSCSVLTAVARCRVVVGRCSFIVRRRRAACVGRRCGSIRSWGRVVSSPERERHSRSTPEASRRLAGEFEPDAGVEAHHVRVRDHVDVARSGGGCALRAIVNEETADSVAHHVGLHEQVVEFAAACFDGQQDRGAEASSRCVDGDADSSLGDCLMWRCDRVRMGCQLCAVLLLHVR